MLMRLLRAQIFLVKNILKFQVLSLKFRVSSSKFRVQGSGKAETVSGKKAGTESGSNGVSGRNEETESGSDGEWEKKSSESGKG